MQGKPLRLEIGHRSLEDPRNALARHFVRLVSELDAQTFVFENVKGLTVGKQKVFLEELVMSFEERGYQVVLPRRVLDAADFGVPQRRERLILIGAKKELHLPKYPAETTAAADREQRKLFLPLGPTCGTLRKTGKARLVG
jgi:DNA (cytosine-5)-methyltransferase 1